MSIPVPYDTIQSLCLRFDIPYDQSSALILASVCLGYLACYLDYCQRSATERRAYTRPLRTIPRPVPAMATVKKNIVIIGASSAGTALAQSLSKSLSTTTTHRIILLDSSSYAYWPVASLRAAVVPGWESKVSHVISTENIFGRQESVKGEGQGHVFVKARVVELLKDGVRIEGEFEGSEILPFDILTIATGASQSFPMRPDAHSHTTVSDLEEAFRKTQVEIEGAQKVLIIGGGPTGIEMAGEIVDRYATKSVTLLHRNTTLLDTRFYLKLATALEHQLKARGVTLILGDEHVQDQGWERGKQSEVTSVKTIGGKSIEADYIFLAAGNTPNTSLISQIDPAALEPKSKLIRVNKYLQVESSFFAAPDRVFAVGDCANSEGWRSIIASDADTTSASTNILNVVKNKSTSLKPRAAGPRALVVPIGFKDGAGFARMPLLGDSLLPGFAVPMIKGKGLFVDKFEGRYVK